MGGTSAGVSQTREMPLVRMISDCPWIDEPSPSSACSVSGVPDAGTTCPRTARIRLTWRTPSSKSPPSIAVIAAIRRLPTAWPASPDGSAPGSAGTPSSVPGKRYWRTSFMSGSASASAAMQLRMSPTGGMPSYSRSTPDEPPSSATVTMAVRLLVCSLRPRSRVDRPVPPPMATIRGPRARNRFW